MRVQFLLDETVFAIQAALPSDIVFGDVVSTDTKHILAWTRENNPKAYIKEGRFDKTRQLKGDPNCRLGCKRRRNQSKNRLHADTTLAKEGKPASSIGVGIGEFYWGYASGVIATKVPGWGEFVLAELTQTFDKSDPSYFFPLMAQVERRLGRQPRYGTADAAYDAFYIYAYFHDAGGFAAVPLTKRGSVRLFDEENKPLCAAGLSMILKGTFMNRTVWLSIPANVGGVLCSILNKRLTLVLLTMLNGQMVAANRPLRHLLVPDFATSLTVRATSTKKSTNNERPLSGFSA